jgi:hypothetical protein
MATRRRSWRIQSSIQQAAVAFAREKKLRGGPAYHLAKVSGVSLSSVQTILAGDNRHIANMEALADALGLVIEIRHKGR